MVKFRIEKDSLGDIKVESTKLWGAQTQRSIENFQIGIGKFHFQNIFIEALALQKKSCAFANAEFKLLPKNHTKIIGKVCDLIISGKLNDHFPLVVWQTGSGTQINMNINEVIANKSNQLLGRKLPTNTPLHPNDHINRSQSSNDSIPTAMHIATVLSIKKILLSEIAFFKKSLKKKIFEFKGIIKIGRTHTQDATPIKISNEFLAFYDQISYAENVIKKSLDKLYELAQGGTAVGSGVNAPKNFSKVFIKYLRKETKLPFKSAPNKYESLASHDVFIEVMSDVEILTSALFKMANDIRVLASGPRSGISEIILPANEPGSSIMPGKINPTQCEALTMIAVQVMGNDAAIGFAGASGNFQLNVYNPVLIYNLLQSIRLLADGADSFNDNCVAGIDVNPLNIEKNLQESLMLVTALNTHIGYDNAAKIAKKAHKENTTLKQAALDLELLTAEQFDKWVDPKSMI